jgi:hypothetical protein
VNDPPLFVSPPTTATAIEFRPLSVAGIIVSDPPTTTSASRSSR